MADDLAAVWRSAVNANMRYWEAWGRIANDYLCELGDTLKGHTPSVRLPTSSVLAPTVAVAPARQPSSLASASPAPPAASSLVLEAVAGATATGAILVENHLPYPVTAAVEPHFGPAGVDDGVVVEIQPRSVELAPGESSVVRISAVVPTDGPDDVRGELLVPELAGTRVALVIRRVAGELGTQG